MTIKTTPYMSIAVMIHKNYDEDAKGRIPVQMLNNDLRNTFQLVNGEVACYQQLKTVLKAMGCRQVFISGQRYWAGLRKRGTVSNTVSHKERTTS